nr:aldehyde dehydrogenase [uncultured Flavobacterium sp.]
MHSSEIINQQRKFFYSGKTQELAFRKEALLKLKKVINVFENDLIAAVHADFKKSEFETILTEISMIKLELSKHISNLNNWSKPQKVRASILNFPSKEYIYKQPFGIVLIISPWNYPLLLAIQPLISAIAAGNCVVLKPSEISSNTSAVIAKMINEIFPTEFVSVILGDVKKTTEILENKFDKIFFTGSTFVGKIIQKKAAETLTPTILELGGKSPCVITKSANLEIAAKRITFGKFVNAGQTCIAPDFLWIDESIKDKFLAILKRTIVEFYGNDIQNNPDFPRVINNKQFLRLEKYLNCGKLYFGGKTNASENYIEPTILDAISFDDAVMQEEIFGPILPVLTYKKLAEVITHNHQNEKPLAMYLFSTNETEIKNFMTQTQFGGGCINDILSHIINDRVPFGGFGASGIGNYHGKFGFDAFVHFKTVVHRKNWLDFKIKYAPYAKKTVLIKKLLSKF